MSGAPKNPWKKILWISGSIIALLLAATMTARFYPNPVDQDIAAIHAMGYPTTEDEIFARSPQKGKNADDAYQQFIEQSRKATDTNDFRRLTYSSNKNPISATDRKDLVAKFRYLLPPIIEGSKAPQWTPRQQRNETYRMWISNEPAIVQDGFRLLMQTAIVDMESHQYTKAMEEFSAGQRIIAQISARPTMNAYLFAGIEDNLLIQALTTVVDDDHSIGTLNRIESLLVASPSPPNPRTAFYAEFVNDVLDARDRAKPEHGADLWTTVQDRFWARSQAQRLSTAIMNAYRDAFAQLPRDENDVEGMRRVFVEIGAKHAKDPALNQNGMTAVTDVWADRCDRYFNQLARHRVLLAGVRVLIARQTSGKYPSSLPSKGDDAIDPFTSRPLVYKVLGNSFVIYSFGPNRVDDGGTQPFYGRPSDIVFRG